MNTIATTPRTCNSLARWCVLVLALVVVAGCTTGFVYNRLDTFARWYVGNLVRLDDEQESALRERLAALLEWHRAEELPGYVDFVRRFAAQVAAGGDGPIYNEAAQEAQVLFDRLGARLAPDLADLALTLSPVQLDELFANLRERDEEELDEEQGRTAADRQRRRTRSLVRNLERWTGEVSSEQRMLIESATQMWSASGLLGEDQDWLASREAWRAQLRAALDAGPTARARIVQLLEKPELSWTSDHRRREEMERQLVLELVVALDATFSDRQRQTAERRLLEFAADLENLSRSRSTVES